MRVGFGGGCEKGSNLWMFLNHQNAANAAPELVAAALSVQSMSFSKTRLWLDAQYPPMAYPQVFSRFRIAEGRGKATFFMLDQLQKKIQRRRAMGDEQRRISVNCQRLLQRLVPLQ